MTNPPRTTEGIDGPMQIRAVLRECRLTVVEGAGKGTTHDFAAERLVIGADPGAGFVIDDRAMSKYHCEIHIEEGAAVVRDLGSRNGTFVDHVQIIEAPLRSGAVLTLGRSQVRFDIGTRSVDMPLSARDSFGRLQGGSVAMRVAYHLLEAGARSDATVLLQGESGTGKDVAAESLHLESDRRDGPFVVVDCGAVAANLLESELFGHESGSFTGADSLRVGAFEAAHGGTLFLDEIGELAIDLQPKLLRAIDRREIRRVGSTEPHPVDVRIVAATNRDLKAEVNARRFRSDLYFRLAVLTVRLAPLRDRKSDIPVLTQAILTDLGDTESEMSRALSSGELLPELMRHAWPGNVRELRNYIESCLARQESALELVAPTEPTIDATQPLRRVRDAWVRHVERRYLQQLLANHDNNVSAAARVAGVDRVHLHRLLRRAGLR